MEIMGLGDIFDDPEAEFSDLLKKMQDLWGRQRLAELSQTRPENLSPAHRQELLELLAQTRAC